MGAYHQMGHSAKNLAIDPRLISIYAGAIMSPLNVEPDELSILCKALSTQETLFDSQCYAPSVIKGGLKHWPHAHTAHAIGGGGTFNIADWQKLVISIADTGMNIGHSGICSPAAVRPSFADTDLSFDIQVGNTLASHLLGKNIAALQTATFPVTTLAGKGRVQTIASILTTGRLRRLYMVPQWAKSEGELQDPTELSTFIELVKVLVGLRHLLIGFCGPEMILWKAAGAQDVASGKYSNQQRFDIARFGGANSRGRGTTAYFFEESLLAWLRTEDIVRLDRLGFKIGLANDPFLKEIRNRIAALQATPAKQVPRFDRNGKPVIDPKTGKQAKKRVGPPDWAGLGWAQWLWWFADAEKRLDRGQITARDMIDRAQANWASLRVKHFIPTDKVSDGRCLPSWSAALKAIGL